MNRKLQQRKRTAIETDQSAETRSNEMSDGPFARFIKDDRGEHAIEFLMILTYGVLPLIAAVFLLEDVFQEYVAFGQVFVSSPFF